MNKLDIFRKIIIANELTGALDAVYRFSDPDGVRSGKSGWSFGCCQFDINNNPSAVLCLRDCGFTTDEIAVLKAQSAPIAPFNAKLKAQSGIVDKWDNRQLCECITVPLQLCNQSKVRFSCDETFLHIADYHNQFYMSRGGKLHLFLAGLNRPVAPEDILNFKLSLLWGQKRPDDVKRRYNNIARIMRG
jgi:hypothetical protein